MTHKNIAKVSKKLWENVTFVYSCIWNLHFSLIRLASLSYCLSSFDLIEFNSIFIRHLFHTECVELPYAIFGIYFRLSKYGDRWPLKLSEQFRWFGFLFSKKACKMINISLNWRHFRWVNVLLLPISLIRFSQFPSQHKTRVWLLIDSNEFRRHRFDW